MRQLRTRVVLLAVAFFLVAGEANAETPDNSKPLGDILKISPDGWELIAEQSDEFDADEIDTNKWNVDPEDWGVWSWEPENVDQKDGSLHLTMVQETHERGGKELYYTSGMVKNDKTITYGYFEARVKGCSRYPGACPAFWLYSKGEDNRYEAKDGKTAAYNEIDVIELQQSEYDFKTKQHYPVTHIDCNLHLVLMENGQRIWYRPGTHPEMCKNEYDATWDPREDYHVYAVANTEKWIIWYIDGKEIGRKPNLYWHLPMHVTLSLGLRYPFSAYKDGVNVSVPEQTTKEDFPTTMSVDYVRVWQKEGQETLLPSEMTKGTSPTKSSTKSPTKSDATDLTKEEFVAMEKTKWEENGWPWNQATVESNFDEIDTDGDGIASGKEREIWFEAKKQK